MLADHRMPEMTGVEFLEQARGCTPRPPRAAHSLRGHRGAIAAINEADVHYYMLKPWDRRRRSLPGP